MSDELRIGLRRKQRLQPQSEPVGEQGLKPTGTPPTPDLPLVVQPKHEGVLIGAPHRQQKLHQLEANSKKTEIKLPGASKKTLAQVKQKAAGAIAQVEAWGDETWGFAGRTGAQSVKVREQLWLLLADLKSATALLAARPTQRAVLRFDKLLAEVRKLEPLIDAYQSLSPFILAPGRAPTAEELLRREEGHRLAEQQEPVARVPLKKAIAEVAESLYVSLAELSGVEQKLLDASTQVFRQDPLAVASAFRAQEDLHEAQNIAFAELEIGGRTTNIGPVHSGGGPSVIPRTHAYESETRPLIQRVGQGGFARSNDTEVQLLEIAKETLKESPAASGSLRIYSEHPSCKSCLRVMSKFRAEHPNIKVEVYSTRGPTQ